MRLISFVPPWKNEMPIREFVSGAGFCLTRCISQNWNFVFENVLFEKQKRMSLNPKPNFLFWAQVGFCTIFFLQFTKDYEIKLIYET